MMETFKAIKVISLMKSIALIRKLEDDQENEYFIE